MAKKKILTQAEEVKMYGAYTKDEMREMGLKYIQAKDMITTFTKEKDALNEMIKGALPAGTTVVEDIVFQIKAYEKGTTDYKMMRKLIEEKLGKQMTQELWELCTSQTNVSTLSVSAANMD